MQAYRLETVVQKDGTLTLSNLPLKAGSNIEVIIGDCSGHARLGKARGVTEADLSNKPAEFAMPNVLVRLALEHDRLQRAPFRRATEAATRSRTSVASRPQAPFWRTFSTGPCEPPVRTRTYAMAGVPKAICSSETTGQPRGNPSR